MNFLPISPTQIVNLDAIAHVKIRARGPVDCDVTVLLIGSHYFTIFKTTELDRLLEAITPIQFSEEDVK